MADTIRLAVSNIAWTKAEDETVYAAMQAAGFTGLELAPTRIFPDRPYEQLTPAMLFGGYLKNRWGFAVPSLQSIWYGQKGSIFDAAQSEELLDYTAGAFRFAHSLNCPSLVFGCPKNRMRPLGADDAVPEAFFIQAGNLAARYGVRLAIEANPPVYTNYLNGTAEAFALDLVGLQHDHEAVGVQPAHELFHLIQLFAAAGAEHHVPPVLLVAAVCLEDGGPPVHRPVDGLADGGAVVGDDQGQHAGIEAEHHPVDDVGGQEVEDQAVDDGVHIPEHQPVGQDDRQRRAEGDVAEGQVPPLGLDGHGDEVQAAGAGVLHIDQRVADAADHAAAQGRQQAVPAIFRQVGQHIVGEQREEDHAAKAAQKEGPPQQFVTAQDDGDVDKDVAQAHGHAEKAVQDGAQARHAGDRDLRRHGKAVDACR